MFYHNHCGCGNRSRNTAMCPRNDGHCFPIKENIARGLFGRGCGCSRSVGTSGCSCTRHGESAGCGCQRSMRASGCGCSHSVNSNGCGCARTARTNGCGCNAYDGGYNARRDVFITRNTCSCQGAENNLNPVCPHQRARMEANGNGCGCSVDEIPSAIPDCDVDIPPVTCHTPVPAQMPQHPVSALAYTQMQDFGAMYTPDVAITRGTAFPGLDKPFCGQTVGERGVCGCKGGLS